MSLCLPHVSRSLVNSGCQGSWPQGGEVPPAHRARDRGVGEQVLLDSLQVPPPGGGPAAWGLPSPESLASFLLSCPCSAGSP